VTREVGTPRRGHRASTVISDAARTSISSHPTAFRGTSHRGSTTSVLSARSGKQRKAHLLHRRISTGLRSFWTWPCGCRGQADLARYPFLIQYSEPTSPLTHSEEAVSKLICCAENRFPINYTPALLGRLDRSGHAGRALAVSVAEALSGLVIHQLVNKGHPSSRALWRAHGHAQATITYAAPEFRLTHSAYADLFHYLGLPSGNRRVQRLPVPDLQQEPSTVSPCSMPHWTGAT